MHSRKIALVVSAALAMVATQAGAGSLTIPHTFNTGDTISSSDMNANFTEVKTEVDDNATGITTNASGITTNASAISTNTTNITTNTTNITTNASGITANASDIATNAGDITTNQGNITTNASAITTNQGSINTNTSDITSIKDAIDLSATALLGVDGCDDQYGDMVRVGNLCVDKYEASVWPTSAGGVEGDQYGDVASNDDYPCVDNGSDCKDAIYARSDASMTPSTQITWFQAAMACANVGKRLPTNAEWQVAALGTPDDADDGANTCVTAVATGVKALTGSRSSCVSTWSTNDMAGNVWEWVADWVTYGGNTATTPTTDAGTAGANYGSDNMRQVSPAVNQGGGQNMPAALFRGGGYDSTTTLAGAYALGADFAPSMSANVVGFRCVK